MKRSVTVFTLIAWSFLFGGCSQEAPAPQTEPPPVEEPEVASGPLVVQASRPPQMMIPVLDGWRSETGGQFELALDDDEEPAQPDLVIYDSVADVWDAAEADELRPVFSDSISANIDTRLRDGEARWVGLSKHGRVVVYDPEQVSAEEIAGVVSYEALREEHWQGRLCLSSSSIGGNRLLVALLINRHDLREAELIVRGWRANFATAVFADDDALLEAISDGTCAIGIAASNDAQAAGVSMHWFDDPATQLVDATTAGVSRHASDPARAAELLEWLTTETPNALFAIQDLEIPANAASPIGNLIADHAPRISAPAPLSDLGFLLEEADRLIERARYP